MRYASTEYPFPGLRPFEFEDREFFFGRDAQIESLHRKLTRNRFLAVVGASGSGKSSLVKAGLRGVLRAEGQSRRKGEGWRIIQIRPKGHPLRELARELARARIALADKAEGLSHIGMEQVVPRASAALTRSSLGLATLLEEISNLQSAKFLVIVDQFEEVFRFPRVGGAAGDFNESALFVNHLLRACQYEPVPIHVLLTMRSDFLGDCAQFQGLPEAISNSQYLTPRLTRGQREEVICKPIEKAGGEIEHPLVQRLLNDSGQEPDQLPVLQHALMRTWQRAQRARRLRLRHYNAIGTMNRAISKHADAIYGKLDEGAGLAELAQKIFKALTDIDIEGREVRRPVEFANLMAIVGDTRERVEQVIDAFRAEDCSFILPAEGPLDDDSVIDISHEALIRKWRRIKGQRRGTGWLYDEIRDGRIYERLVDLAEAFKRNEKLVLSAGETEERWKWWNALAPNRHWARRYGGAFEQVFRLLNASRDALQRQQRRSRIKSFTIGGLVFLLIAGLFIFGQVQRGLHKKFEMLSKKFEMISEEAISQRNAAKNLLIRTLKTQAELEIDRGDAVTGMLLGLQALDRPETAPGPGGSPLVFELERLLYRASNRRSESRILAGHDDQIYRAVFSPDGKQLSTVSGDGTARLWDTRTWQSKVLRHEPGPGPETDIWEAAFTGDGRLLATASRNKTAKIWDTTSGQPLHVLDHPGDVNSLAFSPDGAFLATACEDGTVRVWDVASGRIHFELNGQNGHKGPVARVRFSPDGRRLVSAANDKTAIVWDAVEGRLLHRLRQHSKDTSHDDVIYKAEFSPGGDLVATASRDGSARLWRVETGELVHSFYGHLGSVLALAFSPDGAILATGAGDNDVRLWDVDKKRLVAVLAGHDNSVLSIAFSPDGERLLSASRDGTARLWKIETRQLITVFRGHSSVVRDVAFSPRDGSIVTVSADGTARLWVDRPVDQNVFREHLTEVNAIAFSPDSTLALTASSDNTARLWRVATLQPVHVFGAHEGPVVRAAFNRDGTRVVTASLDKTARVWDVVTGRQLHLLEGHAKAVVRAEFSPDGKTVLTASKDGTARLWNADDGRLRHVLDPYQADQANRAEMQDAVFSPDGRMAATATKDAKVWIWDVRTGRPLHELPGHGRIVYAVAFSPDGKVLASASGDHDEVRLWKTRTGELWHTLPGHKRQVYWASFSPDGKLLVTASRDGTARLWDVETGKERAILSGDDSASLGIVKARFSPDGQRVVTASWDGSARVWNLLGDQLAELTAHVRPVYDARFSPDGNWIGTVSEDGTARLWRVFAGREELLRHAINFVPRCLSPDQMHRFGIPPKDLPRWCCETNRWPYSKGDDTCGERPIRGGDREGRILER